MTEQQKLFMSQVLPLATAHGPVVSRRELLALCHKFGIKWIPPYALKVKTGRGEFDLTHLLSRSAGEAGELSVVHPVVDERTDEEIEKEINDRFDACDRMIQGVADGTFRSVIESGNAGIGKTWSTEYILEREAADGKIIFTSVRGYVKPTGLFKLLYEARHENCVLMFDDADSVFDDEIGLNILKAALDTTKKRTISWRSEKVFETDEAEVIPHTFDFKGSIIFITNKNFDNEIRRNSKLTPHLEALISRSFYLDLNLGFPRELMIRIKSVVRKTTILDDVTEKGKTHILEYMQEHMENLRELSLRMAIKLGKIYNASKTESDFKKMAGASCLKRH